MKFIRRACLLWLLVGLMPAAQAEDTARAPAKPPEKAAPAQDADADDEFLEFLGSIDSEAADEDWLEYLVRTDFSKVAKARKRMPAKPVATEVNE